MFHTILFLFSLTFVAGMPNNEMKPDGDFMHASLKCCKKSIEKPIHRTHINIEECFKVRKEPPSCEMDICIANKLGFASSDGTIDKKALEELMTKDFENDPDLGDVIKEKCVIGDISKYGDGDLCDLIKVKNCVAVQLILNCEDWRDDDNCSKIMASAQTLVKEIE